MKKQISLIVALCLTLSSGIMAAPTPTKEAQQDQRYFEMTQNLDIFNSLFKSLNIHYVDTIPITKMVTAGINGMLRDLDPYTSYIPAEKEKDFKFMTTGEYAGIGSVIMMHNKNIVINEPYEGMPAQKAGIKAGDILLKVDKTDIPGKTTAEASSLLRGTPGTKIVLTLQRPGQKKPYKTEVIREQIYINPVNYYGMLNDSIGYLSLTSFTKDCADEVKKGLIALRKEGMQGLILDLRSNPGGLLNEAIKICNFFLPQGETIVTTRGKGGKVLQTYKTANPAFEPNLPLMVLVDEGSASASEIVAGSLQDLDRAVIVGERTYGKGLVQGTYPVAYDGQLKVTTAKYYIPSGRCIQAIQYTTKAGEKSGTIPDSLTSEFKTRGGRIVRDGRGVSPDFKSSPDSMKTIMFHLITQNVLFNYVTEYCQAHATIPAVKDFSLNDEDFAAIKEYILSQKFEYETESNKSLKHLIEMAQFEGYYEPNKALFDSLQTQLKHSVANDIEISKNDILRYVSSEIVKRYYYQRGEVQEVLKTDKVLLEAVKLFQDTQRYHEFLTPKN